MYSYNSVSQKEMFERQARFEAWQTTVTASYQEQELQEATNEGLGAHLVTHDEDGLACHFCGGDDSVILDSAALPVCSRCMHNALILLEANEDTSLLYEHIRFLVPLVIWSYGQDRLLDGVTCDCCHDIFHDTGVAKIEGSEIVKNICWQCLGAATELYLLGGSLPPEIIHGYPEGQEPPEVEKQRTALRAFEVKGEECVVIDGAEYKSSFRDRKHILLSPLF